MTRLALYVVLRLAHLTGCAALGHRWEFTDYRAQRAEQGVVGVAETFVHAFGGGAWPEVRVKRGQVVGRCARCGDLREWVVQL